MRITKKKFLSVVLVLLLLLVGAGVAVYAMVGGTGQSPLEAWVGQQVKKTINGYLVPELAFDEVDYQAPKTVHLKGVRLVAADPDAPGQTIDIFEAESMTITLAKMPLLGQPLEIEDVTLEKPTLRLVTPEGGGPLIGYSELVQAEPEDDAPPLSAVLRLKRVALRDAAVVLDTREPGTEPTVFDEVTTDLHIDQEADGLYHLELDLDRSPALTAAIDARLNIDQLTLDIAKADIGLALDREQDRYLPQSLQAFMKPYDLTGEVALSATGLLELNAWQDSTLDAELQVTGMNALVGDYRVVGERLFVVAAMAERGVTLKRIEADIFDGEIRGDGVLALSTGYPFDLRLGGTGLDLEKTLPPPAEEGLRPRYAGTAAFNLTANGPLTEALTELRGEGTLEVRDGRIARIAVISDLIDFMESGGDLSRPEDGAPAGRDRADVAFRLRGDHAYLSSAELVGSWFALRAKGKLHFDQSLNINVNAGPLEKMQDVLGAVGDVLGAVTDSLLAYRVKGTVAEPTITPIAFGGLRGAPGSDEEDLPPWTPPADNAQTPEEPAPPAEAPRNRRPGGEDDRYDG